MRQLDESGIDDHSERLHIVCISFAMRWQRLRLLIDIVSSTKFGQA
jgi:hypothetical protein